MGSVRALPSAGALSLADLPHQPSARVVVPPPSRQAVVPSWHPGFSQSQRQEGPPLPSTGMPQPGRTSPALIARRAQDARDARALTSAMRDAHTWPDLEQLFTEHKGKLNNIHMSAMMTRLAHLCQTSSTASLRHHPKPTRSHRQRSAGFNKQDVPALRLFLSTLVPYIGMHMLSLGPRQLANIMWALGSLGYRPQPAWMVEWSSCVARKLNLFTPQDLAMSAWGLVASGATHLGNSSGAPGALVQLSAAATHAQTRSHLRPQDISNLCWALAASGLRPQEHVMRVLVEEADKVLACSHNASTPRHGWYTDIPTTPHATAMSHALGSVLSTMDTSASTGNLADLPDTHQHEETDWGRQPRASASYRFSPQELSSLLWAMAKLGYWPGEDFLKHALNCFLDSTPTPITFSHAAVTAASLPDLNKMVHSWPGLGDDTPSIQCPTDRLHHRPAYALQCAPGPRQHAVVLWALARLCARPDVAQVGRLLSGSLGLCATDQGTLPGSSTQTLDIGEALRAPHIAAADLAQTVWALGRLRYQPSPACWRRLLPGVLASLGATAAEAVDVLAPVDVLHFGQGVDLAQAGQLRLGRVTLKQASLGTSDARNSVTGRVWLPVRVTKSMRIRLARRQAWQQWRQRGRWPHNDTDSHVQLAAQQVQQLPPALVALCKGQASRAGGGRPLVAAEVVAVLWGLRRLRLPTILPVALQQVLPLVLAAITPELGQLPLLALVQLASSCAVLHVQPPDVFVKAWADRLLEAMPVLDEQQLAVVLWSLVVMRKRPPAQFHLAATRRAYELMGASPIETAGQQSINKTAGSKTGKAADRPSIHQVTCIFPSDDAATTTSYINNSHTTSSTTSTGSTGSTFLDTASAMPEKGYRALSPMAMQMDVGNGDAAEHWGEGFKWHGSSSSLVTILWALGKLRGSALSGAWANAAVTCAAHAVPHLPPAQLSRLLEAARVLRLRPTQRVARVFADRCRTAAAWHSARLGCGEEMKGSEDNPCSIVWEGGVMEGMGGPECEVSPPCRHVQRVAGRLRAWRQALVADEKNRNAAANRAYTKTAGDVIALL